MNILIIGSQGFIGSHCASYFSQKGHQIWQAGLRNSKDSNFTRLSPSNSDFECLFQKEKFDVCINASGSANVGFSFENPAMDFELNVLNVHKILVAIRNSQPHCRLINFSSAAVYGNPTILPISENLQPRPLSPYGFHKLQSEYLLTEYHKFFGLLTTSLRVFSAYGERLKKQLFWELYHKFEKEKEVELFGTGEESRDFIYILDLMEALDILIQKGSFEGDVLNIGSGNEITIKEASSIFASCIENKKNIKFTGKVKVGDPNNWRADISAISKMGFKPKTTLKEGLGRYIQWLKEEK